MPKKTRPALTRYHVRDAETGAHVGSVIASSEDQAIDRVAEHVGRKARELTAAEPLTLVPEKRS